MRRAGTSGAARRARLSAGLVALCVVAAVALPGCGPLSRYQVTQTAVDDCVIRPSGEFCEEEERLPPPTVETWSIELLEEHTVLYIGNETWVADGIEGQRTVEKEERTFRNGCTTTLGRTLTFDHDVETLTGTLEIRTRVEGPERCGETPFGTRRLYQLSGTPSTTI